MSDTNEHDLSYIQAIEVAGFVHKIREKEPLTENEQQALETWLNSDAAHPGLLEQLLDRKLVTGELKAMNRYDAQLAVATIFKVIGERPVTAIPTWKRWMGPMAIAASILLILGMGWWFFFLREGGGPSGSWSADTMQPGYTRALLRLSDGREVLLDSAQVQSLGRQGAATVAQDGGRIVYTATGNGSVVYNTIVTPPGGQYRLSLADGSEVWLNAASSITYPTSFPGNSREVTVTGEAFFQVARDQSKPFLVSAQQMTVEVLGTEFNVMAYADEEAVRTTLIAGAVKAGDTGQQRLTLQPGQQAVLAKRSGQLRIEQPTIEDVIAWRMDTFRFRETDMPAIMRQVARWYNVQVEYQGSVADIRFSGPISRKEKMEDLLAILSDTRNVHFEIKDNNTIVVIPGPK